MSLFMIYLLKTADNMVSFLDLNEACLLNNVFDAVIQF